MTRLAIIGTGYVGLTTGVCFAHLGHDVVCADIDAQKVAKLSRGEVPIVEHRLDELLAEGLRKGNLRFVVGAAAAVADAEIVFLCVPTPQGDDGSADLSYVEAAAAEIASALAYEAIVVNKSTVPVGIATHRRGNRIFHKIVAANPSRCSSPSNNSRGPSRTSPTASDTKARATSSSTSKGIATR